MALTLSPALKRFLDRHTYATRLIEPETERWGTTVSRRWLSNSKFRRVTNVLSNDKNKTQDNVAAVGKPWPGVSGAPVE